ncbi:MAG: tRNA (N6-isopentenyl adenosine(37)-C2)-methylthiotransferase MiaB [Thermodesulfobacteriota bacterium]|nr:tRNA (N6-isopentenyl adenosine(37)-C2)-methylthiotransferase MiaB [Thermodesulfobacteriota bacterium]
MKSKTFHINTIGCQMNVYDSSKMAAMLVNMGYSPAASPQHADLVIVNTCTIRAKAKQKATSFLGRLASAKRRNPGMVIGVGGCVAQEEGRRLLGRFPQVDIVFGTHAVSRLPALVKQVVTRGDRLVDVETTPAIDEAMPTIRSDMADQHPGMIAQCSEFVTIMRGCDNYCTYCVVPHVRGRETSRAPDMIVKEVEGLVSAGIREVTLLGQNVNSYGKKEGLCTFAELLAMVNDIEGLMRIRFTTSHPKDLSRELVDAFGRLEKVCSHFHLPVQSGSNRILKRMNRKYTKEQYLEKLSWLRAVRPDIAITTDIIAGFPGETTEDFEETLSLLEAVSFDSIFAFMYSDRSLAPAATFGDKVPEAEKNRRLNTLLSVQEQISQQKNRTLCGRTESVLVEGTSRIMTGKTETNGRLQWSGRTGSNKVVNFVADDTCHNHEAIGTGALVDVAITDGFAHSLRGTAVSVTKQSVKTEGCTYAA